ncbi:MAG: porphobilinogen synthase [Candidatus Korobacteraceae bacterium]
MAFPTDRPRRLRRTEAMRSFVRETRLSPEGFVYPLFVCPGEGIRKEIRSMPGVYNLSIDEAVKECAEVKSLGIPSVIFFGLPESKDEVATGAWADDGIVQKAARAIKREVPGLLLMGDVCLCEYMSHGHCGLVDTSDPNAKALREALEFKRELESKGKRVVVTSQGTRALAAAIAVSGAESQGAAVAAASQVMAASAEDYEILNDPTLELLARTAVSQAKAGMDIIAPSDMMDGRVAAIRTALDENGFQNIPVLSYAAKFASGFYGPFREAADSAPHFGDRRSYQMDPANLREAMREIELDLEEGADMIMVKPAMPYLDVLHEARLRFDVPLAAYQVSGEYAMIKAAALNNWIDYERVMMESLLCIQRAGASIMLTYFAKEAARLLA